MVHRRLLPCTPKGSNIRIDTSPCTPSDTRRSRCSVQTSERLHTDRKNRDSSSHRICPCPPGAWDRRNCPACTRLSRTRRNHSRQGMHRRYFRIRSTSLCCSTLPFQRGDRDFFRSDRTSGKGSTAPSLRHKCVYCPCRTICSCFFGKRGEGAQKKWFIGQKRKAPALSTDRKIASSMGCCTFRNQVRWRRLPCIPAESNIRTSTNHGTPTGFR